MKLLITILACASIIAVGEPKGLIVPNIPIEAVKTETIALEELSNNIPNQIYATVYSYNSEISQCDSDPTITASGHHLTAGDRIVANNCLPFGTVVYIEEIRYAVEDRMNSRYGCEVYDIWMESKEESIKWGKRYLEITILSPVL